MRVRRHLSVAAATALLLIGRAGAQEESSDGGAGGLPSIGDLVDEVVEYLTDYGVCNVGGEGTHIAPDWFCQYAGRLRRFVTDPVAFLSEVIVAVFFQAWVYVLDAATWVGVQFAELTEIALLQPLVAGFSPIGTAVSSVTLAFYSIALSTIQASGIFAPIVAILWITAVFVALAYTIKVLDAVIPWDLSYIPIVGRLMTADLPSPSDITERFNR